MWQYSWSGTVPGIAVSVDRDRFLGSPADLAALAADAGEVAPEPGREAGSEAGPIAAMFGPESGTPQGPPGCP